jgi:hypothetical protein
MKNPGQGWQTQMLVLDSGRAPERDQESIDFMG